MRALGKGSIASVIRIGLSVAHVVVLVMLGLVAVAAVALLVLVVLNALGVTDFMVRADGEVTMEQDGMVIRQVGEDTLAWPLWAFGFAAALVALAGAAIIIDRLKRLFDSFTSNEPFKPENATHLRVIWITLLVLELSKHAIAASVLFAASVFGVGNGVDLDVDFEIDLTNWAAILVLIVLAEVFREGARMREEQDLTI